MAAAAPADAELSQSEQAQNQTDKEVSFAASQTQENAQNGALKKPRQKRPNYHEIHAKPLPLNTYPLPAFIPHNPLSIVRIAITLISHSVRRPSSHLIVHKAYYSPETQSIHVTDPASIRALWEQGFWGKGSLSRSEPQWLVTEKRRRGVETSKTSAEVTQSRREERKQFKLERAKAQREAIEQQLRQEGKLDADGSIEELVEDGRMTESPRGTIYTPEAKDVVTVSGDAILIEVDKSLAEANLRWGGVDADAAQESELQDLEHLQLTPEEAFFLTYALGVLEVYPLENATQTVPRKPFSAAESLKLYCSHAPTPSHLDVSLPTAMAPDNQFMLNYVVYHHFRSLGWVPRPGVKFAVDYLLYMRGPAFSHAEFAIMIIPSYSDPYWSSDPNHAASIKQRDWWWLHRVNRVQTQVMKTLLLVYVEIPPPWASEVGEHLDVGNVLNKYSVREFVFKRWSPSRNRD
ncbi:tRNA splicing endonuclease subunit sen2 [Coniothyrium glycines]